MVGVGNLSSGVGVGNLTWPTHGLLYVQTILQVLDHHLQAGQNMPLWCRQCPVINGYVHVSPPKKRSMWTPTTLKSWVWGKQKAYFNQMVSWWTKHWPHPINIRDTVTNVVPLCSIYQAPSYEHSLILLSPFSTLLAHSILLIVLEISRTDHLGNKYHIQKGKLMQKLG